MAISEQLKQQINNLAGGTIVDDAGNISSLESVMKMVGPLKGAISNEEMEIFKDAVASGNVENVNQVFNVLNNTKGVLSNAEMQLFEDAIRTGNISSLESVMKMVGKTKESISDKEMEMFRDAVPSMGLTRADGLNTMPTTPELTKPEIALERIKGIARNVEDPDELQRLLQVINNMSDEIEQSKAAISDREMELFKAAPGGGMFRDVAGTGDPEKMMGLFKGAPSMGLMRGGRGMQTPYDSLKTPLDVSSSMDSSVFPSNFKELFYKEVPSISEEMQQLFDKMPDRDYPMSMPSRESMPMLSREPTPQQTDAKTMNFLRKYAITPHLMDVDFFNDPSFDKWVQATREANKAGAPIPYVSPFLSDSIDALKTGYNAFIEDFKANRAVNSGIKYGGPSMQDLFMETMQTPGPTQIPQIPQTMGIPRPTQLMEPMEYGGSIQLMEPTPQYDGDFTRGAGQTQITDPIRTRVVEADETQQAIDSLTQELQMTTDPEEAEGLGRMIAKLSAGIGAPMGFMGKALSKFGRGEDTALAHVRPGEIVLPPEMMEDPQFEAIVEEKFNQLGINPEEAVVSMGIASLNESTGLEEFGFFKKLGKKLGKIVKKVAPIAMLVPGVGTALGGVLGGLGSAVTSGLGSIGLGGVGSALGSLGTQAMSGIANLGIPGLSSIAGGTAGSWSSIGKGLGSMKGLLGEGPLSGFLGGGDLTIQPGDTLNEIAAKNNTTVAEIMKANPSITDPNMIQAGATLKMPGGGRSIFGGTPGQSGIGTIEDRIRNRISDPVREGGGLFDGGQRGSMFGGGQGGGLGALGTAGLVGLAGTLGKMAYDETKKDTGVPLTPLNTMNAAGRFNLEAEIARRMGQQAPNPVEFGLLPQNTFPELSGGQPAPVAMNMGGYVMPMQYAKGGNVAVEDFARQNGMINGMGNEISDDVPAMLSDGEFVMTGQAVRGAGAYEMEQGDGGILNLIPSLDEDRERGTELMYNMMEVFSNRANAS